MHRKRTTAPDEILGVGSAEPNRGRPGRSRCAAAAAAGDGARGRRARAQPPPAAAPPDAGAGAMMVRFAGREPSSYRRTRR